MEFICKKCDDREYFLQEKGPQVGLYCANCGSWFKWIGKKDLGAARNGKMVFKAGAEVKLKQTMNLGVMPTSIPVSSPQPILQQQADTPWNEIDMGVQPISSPKSSTYNIEETPLEPCIYCDATPLKAEGDDVKRVELIIYDGVLTVTGPDGLSILGMFRLKRCPECGRKFKS